LENGHENRCCACCAIGGWHRERRRAGSHNCRQGKIAAKKTDGVTDVTVSYNKAAAEVTYDPAKTTPDAIAKVIGEKTGYKAEASRPGK